MVAAYDLLLRDERFANSVVPDFVLRFGEMPTSKPLRAWLAASGAERSRRSTRAAAGTSRRNRAAAILRADPTELASGWAARLEKEQRGAPEAWIAAEAAAASCPGGASSRPAAPIAEPALHRALGAPT